MKKNLLWSLRSTRPGDMPTAARGARELFPIFEPLEQKHGTQVNSVSAASCWMDSRKLGVDDQVDRDRSFLSRFLA
ncbi:MAG: hypothetical protein JXQ99_01965 [Hyphomicrobiaceae bacterium]